MFLPLSSQESRFLSRPPISLVYQIMTNVDYYSSGLQLRLAGRIGRLLGLTMAAALCR